MAAGVGRIRCVLFDLDGTLVDTAPDLVESLNQVRGRHGFAPLPLHALRHVVSHGASALIIHGFRLRRDDPMFQPYRSQLLETYRHNLTARSVLFPGIAALLEQLEERRVIWGVVTNKPQALTEPLLQQLGLRARAACVVSGDTLEEKKPHPRPLRYAVEQCGCEPYECVYVGDAERDIIAARAAGTASLVAGFGYLGPNDVPQVWGANAVVRKPAEILAWLDQARVPT